MHTQYDTLVRGFPYYLQDHKPSASQMVEEMRQHGGLMLDEFVTREEWTGLVREIDRMTESGTYHVVTRSHVPAEWPQVRNPSCRHITHDAWLPQHVTALQKAQKTHKHHDHGADASKDFYLPYGTENHERERVMRAIESLNLLTNSHYSRPMVSITRDQLPVYPEQPINVTIKPRTMESEDAVIDKTQRFMHGTNWHTVRPYMLASQVAVVLDNYCFNDDYSGLHSEKMLYPIAAGIPWIYAGNRHQRRLMLDRGFQPHMPMAETIEQLIDQMLWLKAVFTNPEMTRNWQQSQGEKIIKNQKVLDGLDQRLLAESTLYR
jgi:hypothetical protein